MGGGGVGGGVSGGGGGWGGGVGGGYREFERKPPGLTISQGRF